MKSKFENFSRELETMSNIIVAEKYSFVLFPVNSIGHTV